MFKSKKAIIFLTFINLFALTFSNENIPRGYKNIQLGMTLDQTKEELIKTTEFGYHGDRDVSLLPGDNKKIIETDAQKYLGSSYLTRCWFQFSNDNLYIITINLNTEKLDYYSVFTTLCKKYGEPQSFTPSQAQWKNNSVSFSLEKPLTLKYIDNDVFESLQSSSNISPSYSEQSKEEFLGEL